jgi:hypothetical protein
MTQESPNLACYSHRLASLGIVDFVSKLPNGYTTFRQHLADFARSLYAAQSTHGERYFLDKTPRYYWIIDDIADIFPDSKFIFLFRDPLQVVASILSTWGNGRLRGIETYKLDIQYGIPSIAQASTKYPERSLSIHYERLVADPHAHLEHICEFLDIPPDTSVVDRIDLAQIPGRFGDPTGARTYSKITAASVDKWRDVLASPYRRWLIARWLKPIPPELRAAHNPLGTDPLNALRGLPLPRRSWAQAPRDLLDHARSVARVQLVDHRLRCPSKPWEPSILSTDPATA